VKYRPLGQSGITVSVLGFGAWGIGGRTPGATSYGETDDTVSLQALEEAFARGITFYDTASVYGNGHSEELIGACFAGRRDKVVIATKAGIQASFAGYDFSEEGIRNSLEDSLRRLRTDYVDVLQLHNVEPKIVLGSGNLLELLQGFVRDGKVRAYGFSVPSPDDALALLDVPGTASLQVNCNLLDWRAVDNGLFERARDRHVGIVARTPLAFGFLTGRLKRGATFAPDDHRSRWSSERVDSWIEVADGMFATLGWADNTESRIAAALRFCLGFDAVTTVIPGMLSPHEVAANVAAIEGGPLDRGVMRNIEQVYRRYEARLRM